MTHVSSHLPYRLWLYTAILAIGLNGPACSKDKAPANASDNTPAAVKPQDSRATAPAPDSAAAPAAAQPVAQANTVDVYLFHGTYRCYSCNLMEELTLEALAEAYEREQKNGTIRFQHINVQQEPNKHYVEQYKLAAISIVVSQKSGDTEKQWKNLDKVWALLRNRDNFKQYIQSEVKSYL